MSLNPNLSADANTTNFAYAPSRSVDNPSHFSVIVLILLDTMNYTDLSTNFPERLFALEINSGEGLYNVTLLY